MEAFNDFLTKNYLNAEGT